MTNSCKFRTYTLLKKNTLLNLELRAAEDSEPEAGGGQRGHNRNFRHSQGQQLL
jgi:hypothetical protein